MPAWIKQATIYKETTVTTKAKIFYFHGGGLLYGFRKDLPEKHISVITQAGYEIISFDYPLAPAADLEQIVPDICDSAWRSVPSVTCLIPKRFSLTFPLLSFFWNGYFMRYRIYFSKSSLSDLNINNNNNKTVQK